MEQILGNPQVVEAVLSASPTLVDSWRAAITSGPDSVAGASEDSVFGGLLKYLIRMTTRPTPFAALSAIGFGEVSTYGSYAAIIRAPADAQSPQARLDEKLLASIVRVSEHDPRVRAGLRWFFSPSAYFAAGRCYLPYGRATDTGLDDDAVSVRASRPLKALSQQAASPRSWEEIVSIVRCSIDAEVPQEQLEAYAEELHRQGIILSDVWPPTTSPDHLEWVLARLEAVSPESKQVEQLQVLKAHLATYNKQALGDGAKTLAQLFSAANFGVGTRQSVLAIDTPLMLRDARIGLDVGTAFAEAARLTLRLAIELAPQAALREYRHRFIGQYGTRLIPVLRLLDEDVGLGAPAGYLHPVSRQTMPRPARAPEHTVRERTLLQLAADAASCGAREVVLDDSILDKLTVAKDWESHIPDSLDLFASIIDSADTDGSEEFRLVIGPRTGQQPAGSALARFCHLDPAMAAWLKGRARDLEQERPDTMFADLTYSHVNAHVNNVSVRPALYSNQIVVNGTPDPAGGAVIRLGDVGVGATTQRFHLVHLPTGRPIVTRSTHLLNDLSAPNVCRFLQEVSDEALFQVRPLDWGAARELEFLPRLRYRNIVICVARWRLPDNLATFHDVAEWLPRFQSWRARRRVPRHVLLTEADHRLHLDLESKQHLRVLATEVRMI